MIALLLALGTVCTESEERIDALVHQLGDVEFQMRQAASQELVNIGEPALPALRKATSDADPEIRWRAAEAVRAVRERIRAATTKKALAELQGTWHLVSYQIDGKQVRGEDKNYRFTVRGDKWSSHDGGQLLQAGTIARIEVQEKFNAIDLPITAGGNIGVTATSIYAIDGDTLKYLNCGEPRATEFAMRPGDGRNYLIYRRASAKQ